MHFTLPILLFGFLLVLQQTTHIESLISPILSPDNEAARPSVARRLRASLMGRSLLSTSDDDNVPLSHDEFDSDSLGNYDDLVLLGKRRSSVPLFGRRWILKKRRGPLFG